MDTLIGRRGRAVPARAPEVEVVRDPTEWDRLAGAGVGGDYRQSAGWAEAKRLLGWESIRILVRSGTDVLAGAQVLTKQLGPLGRIGYVPRGPWLTRADDGVGAAAVEAALRQMRQSGVRLLCVAPPDVPIAWELLLNDRGFRPTRIVVSPRYTTVVDLTQDDDALLAGMHKKTRYNVRLAERRDVVVREGGPGEVDNFFALYEQTSARRSFLEPQSLSWFRTLHRALDTRGHVRLVFADVDGQPTSAMVLITFGGVATYYRGAWSGTHADRHPNEAMHFGAMRIARAAGCRRYDFEDIGPAAARARREHGRVDRSVDALSAFKLSFGGDVLEFPAPRIHARGRATRAAYRLASSPQATAAVRAVLRRVRNVEGAGRSPSARRDPRPT